MIPLIPFLGSITLGAGSSYEDFKNALGQRESGNNYSIVNPYGYTGRYQFGKARLSDLGYKGTMAAFKNNPSLQEQYFDIHVADYAKRFQGLVAKAQQRISTATLSGLIAGAHLLGAGGLQKFVNNGIDGKDANGTRISSYITQFSGYDIPGYTTGEKKTQV